MVSIQLGDGFPTPRRFKLQHQYLSISGASKRHFFYPRINNIKVRTELVFEHYSSVSNHGFILLSQDHFNNYILTWFVTLLLLSLYVLIELYLFDCVLLCCVVQQRTRYYHELGMGDSSVHAARRLPSDDWLCLVQ